MFSSHYIKSIIQFDRCPICNSTFNMEENPKGVANKYSMHIGCNRVFESFDGGISRLHHYGATVFKDEDFIIYRRLPMRNKIHTVECESKYSDMHSRFYIEDLKVATIARSYHGYTNNALAEKIEQAVYDRKPLGH